MIAPHLRVNFDEVAAWPLTRTVAANELLDALNEHEAACRLAVERG